MTKLNQILDYVKAHPGSTNHEIAIGLARHVGAVSATTSYLEQRGQLTSVSRTKAGTHFIERCYTFKSRKATRDYVPKPREKKLTALPLVAPATPVFSTPSPVAVTLEPEEKQMLFALSNDDIPETPAPANSLDAMVDSLAQHIAKQLLPLVYKHLLAELPSVLNMTTNSTPTGTIPDRALNMKIADQQQPRTPGEILARRAQYMDIAPRQFNDTALDDSITGLTPKPKTRLPKVVVLGLLPTQAGHIQSEFHKLFDLEFWNTSDGDNRLTSKISNARQVFVHTNHMGHQVIEQLKCAGVSYKLVGGGMSQLREFLKAFHIETQTPTENKQ